MAAPSTHVSTGGQVLTVPAAHTGGTFPQFEAAITALNPHASSGSEIFQAQKKLLETGTFSDLTIHCGDTVWHVHRAVLAPRCAFFDRACSGKFAEAESQVIELLEDDPEAVDTMLQYLYTLVVPSLNTLEKARKAFETADKYDLANLSVSAKNVLLSVFQVMYSPSAGFGVLQPTYKPVERFNDYWTWIQQCSGDTTEFQEALAMGCAGHVGLTMIQGELIEYASENPEFGVLFMTKLEERARGAEDALTDRGHRVRRHQPGSLMRSLVTDAQFLGLPEPSMAAGHGGPATTGR